MKLVQYQEQDLHMYKTKLLSIVIIASLQLLVLIGQHVNTRLQNVYHGLRTRHLKLHRVPLHRQLANLILQLLDELHAAWRQR